MSGALVLSGGPPGGHDFDAATAALLDVVGGAGLAATVVGEPADAIAALADAEAGRRPPWDLLVVNALRWRMDVERYAHLRDQLGVDLTDADAAVLDGFVRGGGGLLALHTAVICFDAHPTWRALLGAAWDWDRSAHDPVGPVEVAPTRAGADHPVTAELAPFVVVDELYRGLDPVEDVVPLLVGTDAAGATAPVLWARPVGDGRVVTDVLGHGRASLDHPSHRALLASSVAWSRRAPVGAEAGT